MKSMMTILLGMTLSVNALFGQDVITKISGDDIKVRVVEMNADVIKYKDYNRSNDSVFTISKNEVFMINYENGSKTIVYEEKKDANPTDLSSDKIITAGRTFIYKNLPLSNDGLKSLLVQTNDPVINKCFKKAKSKKIAGVVLIVVGGITAGGLVGIAVLTVGICLLDAHKQYQLAVTRYNELVDQGLQNSNNPNTPVSVSR